MTSNTVVQSPSVHISHINFECILKLIETSFFICLRPQNTNYLIFTKVVFGSWQILLGFEPILRFVNILFVFYWFKTQKLKDRFNKLIMKCSGWGRIGRYVGDPHSSGKWFNKENFSFINIMNHSLIRSLKLYVGWFTFSYNTCSTFFLIILDTQ